MQICVTSIKEFRQFSVLGKDAATAALWLLSVFPFDFAHFPEMFPPSIRFALTWVMNEIYVIVLVLTALGSLANAVYASILYAAVRSRFASSRWQSS